MKLARFSRLALVATTGILAAGCAIVPTPDGGVIVPAPVVVTPPAVVVNPWWGLGTYRHYDYGPRYYGGPRYRAGPNYGGRPVPSAPRYWGPANGPSFPSPMR